MLCPMLTYLRYALATICFALSVACLGLWWRSESTADEIELGLPNSVGATKSLGGVSYLGFAGLAVLDESTVVGREGWRHESLDVVRVHRESVASAVADSGRFGVGEGTIYFPLWYASLVFALAGVGVLRLGRFTIRSALIATTIVAGLLGMVVAL